MRRCHEHARDLAKDRLGHVADALDGVNFSSDAASTPSCTPLTMLRAELDLLAEEPLEPGGAAAVERLR